MLVDDRFDPYFTPNLFYFIFNKNGHSEVQKHFYATVSMRLMMGDPHTHRIQRERERERECV